MITRAQSKSPPLFDVPNYTRGWMLGSGVPVNIAPGTYRVAGEDCIAGVDYLRLEGRYRIERPVAAGARRPSLAGSR